MIDIWHLCFYFFVYAVIGWLWETVFCSIKARRFVYRGFLFGPYCPIYGFGVVLLLVLLSPLKGNPALLFMASLVLMSALEYATSYVLEKLFHQRWWDYSGRKFNIKGRIALAPALFWGVMSSVIIYHLQPAVAHMADFALDWAGIWVSMVMVFVVCIDAAYTVTRMAGFSRMLGQLRSAVSDAPEALADHMSERIAQIRKSGKIRFTERRLLKAFPRAKDVRIAGYEKVREVLLALPEKGKHSK